MRQFTFVGIARLTILGLLTTQLFAQNPSEADERNMVAAQVNDKRILLREVDRVLKQQAGKPEPLSEVELSAARLQTLESLIDRELLFERAQKEGLLPNDDQLGAAINEQKKQAGMTDEEFAKQLRDQGITVEELRDEARKDLAIRNLQDKYAAKINVSDREVEDYYKANRSQFVNRRGVSLAMIAVDPADNRDEGIVDDAKGENEAHTKINLIFQQLKSGADFSTVASARSEDRSSLLHGGDIGFATEEDLQQSGIPKDLIRQFFVIRIGSFTAPVRFSSLSYSRGRWYIFKLAERASRTEALTLDSPGVRAQIAASLLNQRKDVLDSALLTSTRNEAKIVNYLALRQLRNP